MTLSEKFSWYEADKEGTSDKTPAERYQRLTDWACRARCTNPLVFDELILWLREGDRWEEHSLSENKKFLMDDIIGRFLNQNKLLHAELTALKPSGIVNSAVFPALERFNEELSGNTHADSLKEAVTAVFQDFSSIKKDTVRNAFAGSPTGPAGTDSVAVFGYLNILKDCDAAIQWTLFMPDLTRQQQDGFRVESFEYVTLPAFRFIGMERDFSEDPEALETLLHTLGSSGNYRCGFDYDLILTHHFGKGVDVEHCHCLWGRFMAADTPVPDGFTSIDFIPQNNGTAGVPYLSRFAFAKFTGETGAMHRQEGFDCDAMYDVTRNIILGQNVPIPYPDKYWTAEVFLDGFKNCSTAYLFSVETQP